MRKRLMGLMKLIAVISIAIIGGSILSGAAKNDLEKLMTPVYQTMDYIRNYYYGKDKLDMNRVVDYTIDGMLRGIDDKFSHYISPKMMEEERIEMGGVYGGLGIEVAWDKDMMAVEVVAPMYGTPAWRAGIKSGDKIVEIDGQPTSEMTFLEAVNKLRGEPGSKVKIKIIRKGSKEPIELEITRALISLIPVKYTVISTNFGKVGYVKITKFMDKTDSELVRALKSISRYSIKALILDLRDNPGGYLNQALKVAGTFLEKGIIVKIKNSFGDEEVYGVDGKSIVRKTKILDMPISELDYKFPKMPIVILVNNGSASASEIVTGALKDNKIATVIGKRTFGKGSVQSGFDLANGGILYLTTAHYLTPSGRDIHGVGIEPDVVVEGEVEVSHETEVHGYTKRIIEVNPDRDPYLKKAIEVLRRKVK